MAQPGRPVGLVELKELIARADYAISELLKTAEGLRQELAYEQSVGVLAHAFSKVEDRDLLSAFMAVMLFRLAGAEAEWGSS